ncbi:MAG: alpha/beta hydrolase-fold protein [Actinomycetota bacterium]
MAWTTSDLPIVCERTGTAHVLSLALPVRYRSLERAPLLFCLDGPWMFGTTVDATRLMSMSSEAPEAAVVGLSFDVDSMGEYLRQRARWFTPTPWVPPTITGVRGVTADECGRADELLRFIEDQALPAAEARLAEHVEPSERWLIGHSFSALFGLTALFRGQTRFDKWLLASPSIWWDDRAVLAIEAAHAAANDDLRAAVFACFIDGGATSTLGSSDAVDAIMRLSGTESVKVDLETRPTFKFGNNGRSNKPDA